MSLAMPQPTSRSEQAARVIRIRGARTHNLKNIDLDIPRDQLVVITGKSGSGKSSLAFDTLFAEGQRQYIESLSTYARQFLNQLERPDVDLIEGLQPTICIDQRPGVQGSRSTVATSTEIYDFLRLLYARLGEICCHGCGQPIRQQSAEQIEQSLSSLAEGTRLMLLAPLVRGRKGAHAEAIQKIRAAGLVRVRVDGQVLDLESIPALDPRKNHTIEAIVDRIILREGVRSRLAESVQLALRHGEGVLGVCYLDPTVQKDAQDRGESTEGLWTERIYSTLYACPNCDVSLEEIEPRTFSFNSPYGACPTCEGLGTRPQFDRELVLPDLSLSLTAGVVKPWKGMKNAALAKLRSALMKYLESIGADAATPWNSLTEKRFATLLQGDEKGFIGLLNLLEQEYATATDAARKEELERYRGNLVCPACDGSRLRPEALAVRIAGKNIHELTSLAIADARTFIEKLKFFGDDEEVAEPILADLVARLGFLSQVGLDYLTLARSTDTLSGGEFQRVRLASGIGSGLTGVCYILDEPSIGLHPRDNDRLIAALRKLQQQRTSVIVVEHDETMMREADWLIDIGPGAGSHGGTVVAQGTPADVAACEESITGKYLAGTKKIEIPKERRKTNKQRMLTVEGATANNLKNVTAHIPLATLVAITGVSGSGKSTLITETLAHALIRKLGGIAPRPLDHQSLNGFETIDRVIGIDQSPIGRSPRSNPATYIGAFDEIRKVYAQTKEARQLGFKASRFSFNVTGGRCEHCQGQGLKRIEMNFLPDLFVECDHCGGKRFSPQTLAVKFRDKSIADVLAMSIEEATDFFSSFSAIHRYLECLSSVGLGYLSLGQSSTTLSGGESQRIKLATELARVDSGNTLYLLDEPTTGLHTDDIRLLLGVLQKLVDRGNTVVVIEHNLDVMKSADWIIDMGPEGGAGGGQIVATGTPEEVAENKLSNTAKFLKSVLSR
ncbi:excinuclease ABC, A subunit [Pirellula staleyi DSM 6068]|uniref:UvrABC system protein A n=1 Tax=Pirellula staleyi (strain ATCC 27377 / DSM 6068 / ICPB 4128) TaxID=530564 RepID=D2R1F4_PIRSD|nr:excinuclease ABC subunit UvrA [Pirellula staleyi]ADB14939.1 excinuclease ABC, A subunit [Pirellula staleyi DSM 6068]